GGSIKYQATLCGHRLIRVRPNFPINHSNKVDTVKNLWLSVPGGIGRPRRRPLGGGRSRGAERTRTGSGRRRSDHDLEGTVGQESVSVRVDLFKLFEAERKANLGGLAC